MTQKRGSAYVAVLGASMLVAVIGMAALTAVRADRVEALSDEDIAQAKANAISAGELATGWITTTPTFRSAYAGMRSAPGLMNAGGFAMPMGTASIELVDNSDGALDNEDYDLVLVRSIGRSGTAQQMFDVVLQPKGIALPILSNAVTTPGRIQVDSGQLEVIGGAAVSGGSTGSVSGSQGSFVGGTIMPPTAVVNRYANLGVAISPGVTMERRVLTTGFSSFGAPSAEGVYVITTSNDLVIRSVRVEGTLVIRAPGRRVTLSGQLFMTPARPDFPALVIDCHTLEFAYESAFDGRLGALSEFALGTNFNPPGAPWGGNTNSTNFDVYPSDIRGLVYTTGRVEATDYSLIRGALIVAEPAGDSVKIAGRLRIIHDPGLVTDPPQWFTSAVTMSVQPGSWRQRVN